MNEYIYFITEHSHLAALAALVVVTSIGFVTRLLGFRGARLRNLVVVSVLGLLIAADMQFGIVNQGRGKALAMVGGIPQAGPEHRTCDSDDDCMSGKRMACCVSSCERPSTPYNKNAYARLSMQLDSYCAETQPNCPQQRCSSRIYHSKVYAASCVDGMCESSCRERRGKAMVPCGTPVEDPAGAGSKTGKREAGKGTGKR